MHLSAQRALYRSIAAVLLAAAAGHAHAADLDYTLSFGVQHNDNVNLSETDPVSQNILVPGLNFSFQEDGSRVRADLSGALEYRDYLGNAFGDTTRSQLNGLVDWTLLPQRMSWSFQDSLGVQPIDELAADTPGNQQQTNAFATGPSLMFGMGKSVQGRFDLRYIDSYAEKTTQFDSTRYAAALQLSHDLSASSRLSGNVQAQDVHFKHTESGPEFSRYDIYADYTKTLASFDLDLAAGYSKLNYKGDLPGSGGPLLRGSLGWRPSARSTFSAALARQYTDAADAMLGGAIGTLPTGVNTGDASVTSQAYLQRSVDLAYTFQDARFGFNVSPYWRDFDYTTSDGFDRNMRGLSAGASYQLRPRVRLGLTATGEREHYIDLARTDRTRSYTANLGYQMTRRLGWDLSFTHYERHSPAAGQTSHQNVVYFQVILRR